MKCSEVRTFLSQVGDREQSITPIPPADLDYLSSNGFVVKYTQDDHDKTVGEVTALSQMLDQLSKEKGEEEQAQMVLQQDVHKEHSFLFHFEGAQAKEAVRGKVSAETAAFSRDQAGLAEMEASVNQLIQKKSTMDRMVPYGGGYVSVTGVGAVMLNDLNVRNYRVADLEFSDYIAEFKATYSELRSIAERATSYVGFILPKVPLVGDLEEFMKDSGGQTGSGVRAPSQLWGVALGLAKLQGDPGQIEDRFVQALDVVHDLDSTIANKLMAAEIMTAIGAQDLGALASALKSLENDLRGKGVPKELSTGVAATIMAGRRFDGTYPVDQFTQFHRITPSVEAASILAVMNVSYGELAEKFQKFSYLFNSWGYMKSEDTEVASAFLSIGELSADEVKGKLQYIVEQLKNYLEYPLVAAAILASIPVFESHEVLDLMEKAVTLLSGCAAGLERSELVALAVRMIHGVRNEIVKEIDPTAKVAATPVQFTYGTHPMLFFRYYPVIVAHSSYHATFSAMGGFHPAHSHGVGGFAG